MAGCAMARPSMWRRYAPGNSGPGFDIGQSMTFPGKSKRQPFRSRLIVSGLQMLLIATPSEPGTACVCRIANFARQGHSKWRDERHDSLHIFPTSAVRLAPRHAFGEAAPMPPGPGGAGSTLAAFGNRQDALCVSFSGR